MTQIADKLGTAGGLDALIEFMKGVYKEDVFTEAYDNYMEFEDTKRGEKETIKMFLPRWDMALAKVKKTEAVIPYQILAFKLLKAINIGPIDMSIITTEIDYEEGKLKKNLQDQARAAIKIYAGKSILKDSDIPQKKTESTYMSEPKDNGANSAANKPVGGGANTDST